METEIKKVYTIDIQGIDSVNDLKSAIEQLTERLKQLNQESKEYKDTLEELAELQTKLADAMKGIGDSTENVAVSLKTVKEATMDATKNINGMTDATQKVKENLEGMGETDGMKGLNDGISGTTQDLEGLSDAAKKAKQDLEGMGNADGINELDGEISGFTKSLETISDTSKDVKDSLDGLGKNNSLDGLKTDISGVTESLETISGNSEKAKESLENIGDADGIKKLSTEIENTTQKLEGVSVASKDAKDGIESIGGGNGIGNVGDEINVVTKSLESVSTESKNAKENIDGLGKTDVTKELSAQMEGLSQNLENVSEKSKEAKGNLESIDDNNGIKGLEGDIKGVAESLENVSVASNDAKGNIESIGETESLNNLSSDVSGVTQNLESVSVASSGAKESLDNMGSTDGIGKLNTELSGVTSNLDGVSDASKKAKDGVDGIGETESIDKLNNEISGTTKNIKSVSDASTEAKESIDGMGETSGIGELNAEITGVTQSMEGVSDVSESVKESLDSMGDTNTIKELRAEIKRLKAEFAELEIGSEGYVELATQIANEERRLKAAMTGVKTTVDEAGESYNSLSIKMRQLKEEYHATNSEARRNELAPQIAEIQQALKDMDAAVLVYGRNVGNYRSALEGLDSEFVSQKQELRELKLAMEQLDPASQAYIDAFNRAAEITHNLADQQESLKYASADMGDQLGNIRGIASNLAAGYTALNAAMGLFGEENENVNEALLKVQQTIALVQGLEGLDGFIKRTQGLSTAMKVWIKTSRESATATRANAAASTADAAAKSAEAKATAGAVAPQLALNAAMKANPIGVILGLVAALVTVFSLLKDKITETIGGNERLRESFDSIKAVLSGFGNVIKKSIINPVKMALIPLKTLGKVMSDVFSGNWSNIADSFKEGMDEMKDTFVDTIDFIGNFREAYEAKMADLDDENIRKRAEKRSKELESQIKDMEAKYDSDKKYTEEARKLYTEYFDSKIAMYKKDTDEYKQAVRDKWTYERDYAKKQDEATKKADKVREEAAKKRQEAEKKRFDEFKSMIDKYLPENYQIEKEIFDFNIKMGLVDENGKKIIPSRLDGYIKKYAETISKQIGVSVQDAESAINSAITKFTKEELQKYSKLVVTQTENEIETVRKKIESLQSEYNYYDKYNEVVGLLGADEETHYESMTKRAREWNKLEIELLNERKERTQKALDNILDIYVSSYDDIEEAIDAMLEDDTYKKLEYERFIIDKDILEANVDMFHKMADAEKEYQEHFISDIKTQMDLELDRIELYGELEKTKVGYFDTWKTEAQISAEVEQQAYESQMYNLQALKEKYQELIEDQKLTAAQKYQYEKDLMAVEIEMQDAELQHAIEVNKRKREIYKNTFDYISTAANGLSTMFGNIATAYEDSINREVEAGEIKEEEAKKKFETVKGIQKAQTLINTFSSAISAFQSMASIPYVGPVLGAAAAAAAIAAGMVQYRNIESTTWQGNSNGAGNTSTTAAYQLPSVMIPEPQYTQNLTNQDDTDRLANAIGRSVGNQRVYVVESDINDAQRHSRKVDIETTF